MSNIDNGDSDPVMGIVNVLGNIEVVSETWDTEITEVRMIDETLLLLLDSCSLKPKKTTVPKMRAVRLDVHEEATRQED